MPEETAKNAALAGAAGAPAIRRPNVLMMMVDEMRWDCLGAAGHPIVQTPNLDQLAAEGCFFSRAYTVSPVCSAARMSLFTGRYAKAHGVLGNTSPDRRPNPGEIVLPLILRKHGYTTGISGKIHLNGSGSQGFDHHDMFARNDSAFEPNGRSYAEWIKRVHPEVDAGCGEGSCRTEAIPETLVRPDPGNYHIGTARLDDSECHTAWAVDRCIDFLRSHHDDEKPWFFFCSTLCPHSPYVIPQPWAALYDPGAMILPQLSPSLRASVEAKLKNLREPKDIRQFIVNEDYLRPLMSHYYGSCSMIDHHFGRALKEIDRLGIRGQTIVVFVADHGNMMGDHGRVFKACMYDGSARIPLIVRAPNLPAGRRVQSLVEITDVMPTILNLCGIPVLTGIQGKSFADLARGEDREWNNVAYANLWDKMMIDGRYKLMTYNFDFDKDRHAQGAWKLFDLDEDPHELRDLIGEPKHAERIAFMKRQMDSVLDAAPPPPAY